MRHISQTLFYIRCSMKNVGRQNEIITMRLNTLSDRLFSQIKGTVLNKIVSGKLLFGFMEKLRADIGKGILGAVRRQGR